MGRGEGGIVSDDESSISVSDGRESVLAGGVWIVVMVE